MEDTTGDSSLQVHSLDIYLEYGKHLWLRAVQEIQRMPEWQRWLGGATVGLLAAYVAAKGARLLLTQPTSGAKAAAVRKPKSAPKRVCSPDFVKELPEEASMQIFSYLDGRDLEAASRVSKLWNRVAADSHVWRLAYQRRWPKPAAMMDLELQLRWTARHSGWKQLYVQRQRVYNTLFTTAQQRDALFPAERAVFLGETASGVRPLTDDVVAATATPSTAEAAFVLLALSLEEQEQELVRRPREVAEWKAYLGRLLQAPMAAPNRQEMSLYFCRVEKILQALESSAEAPAATLLGRYQGELYLSWYEQCGQTMEDPEAARALLQKARHRFVALMEMDEAGSGGKLATLGRLALLAMLEYDLLQDNGLADEPSLVAVVYEALAHMQAMLKIDPEDPRTLRSMGLQYLELAELMAESPNERGNALQLALDSLRHAVQLDGANPATLQPYLDALFVALAASPENSPARKELQTTMAVTIDSLEALGVADARVQRARYAGACGDHLGLRTHMEAAHFDGLQLSVLLHEPWVEHVSHEPWFAALVAA